MRNHSNLLKKPKLLPRLETLVGKNTAVLTLLRFLITYFLLILTSNFLLFIGNPAKLKKLLTKLLQKQKLKTLLRRWLDNINEYNKKIKRQQELAQQNTTTPQTQPNIFNSNDNSNNQANPNITLPSDLLEQILPDDNLSAAPGLEQNPPANLLPTSTVVANANANCPSLTTLFQPLWQLFRNNNIPRPTPLNTTTNANIQKSSRHPRLS